MHIFERELKYLHIHIKYTTLWWILKNAVLARVGRSPSTHRVIIINLANLVHAMWYVLPLLKIPFISNMKCSNLIGWELLMSRLGYVYHINLQHILEINQISTNFGSTPLLWIFWKKSELFLLYTDRCPLTDAGMYLIYLLCTKLNWQKY